MNRITWIDSLRGIAIMLMIPANLAYYLAEPHPMWFRLLSSYAAPIFVMLSAGMVLLTAHKYQFKHYLFRAGMIISVGALLDLLLWRIVPFISFDILYLIGFTIPIIFLLRNISKISLSLIGISCCLIAEMLQQKFGYHQFPLVIMLNHLTDIPASSIIHSIFIDSWFPIFPWFGYACFGAVFFKFILTNDKRLPHKILIAGAIMALVGFAALYNNGNIFFSRFGFSELFYPPTLAFALTLPGIISCCTLLAQYIDKTIAAPVLRLFGQHSLMIYILHQVFGYYVILSVMSYFGYDKIHNGFIFLVTVLVTMLAMYVGVRRVYITKHNI